MKRLNSALIGVVASIVLAAPALADPGTTWDKRRGWRLPSIEELSSLLDPSNPSGNPDLPLGHPFDAQPTFYWSANTFVMDPGFAVGVDFGLSDTGVSDKPNNLINAWCVRGGQGIDGVQ